jgi:hypothetical protein
MYGLIHKQFMHDWRFQGQHHCNHVYLGLHQRFTRLDGTDAATRVTQMPDILHRAIGRQQLKSYAMAREDLLVPVSELTVHSIFEIGGDHHCAWW